MKLSLYNMECEKIRLNKDSYLKHIITMNGTCRNSVSISNPSIIIELDATTLQQEIITNKYVVDDNSKYATSNNIKLVYSLISKILTSNYAYIEEFERYYFISNITIIRNNLYQLDMNCDVLMSFNSAIGSLDCLISRNEKEYNPNIVDKLDYYEYYNDVREYVPNMLSGKTLTSLSSQSLTPTSYVYILNVYNDEGVLFAPSITSRSNVLPSIRTDSLPRGSDSYYVMYATDVKDLLSQLLSSDYSNLVGYIKSLMVLPFNIPVQLSKLDYIRLGSTTIRKRTGNYVIGTLNSYITMGYTYNAYFRIDAPFNDYRDYEPYTTYEIYIPYVGWVKFDGYTITDCNLLLTYIIDINTGSASVVLTDESNNKLIYQSNCQMGIKVGITSNNALEVERNKLSNTLNTSIGLLSSVVGVGVGVGTGNPLAVVGGVISGASTIAKGISNDLLNIERANAQVTSGYSGVFSPDSVRVRISSHQRLFDDVEIEKYLKLYGKPLNQFRKISECSGYTQVSDVHIENISNATSIELNEIESLLKSGIII